ncbi:hypothetical protein [Variovorax sp. MHTC-1]|uniref:hypothetical protein n=1 Tax=Variovorax sp. MHTC-1 TaxID=2495593 RepID=UPI000F8773DD|nr:hypothetical protein [Variovorax sp. MHTC-1]RST55756.1 hypothetical protein EJI01_07945 [Variovorax sp. MHTC-1]
MAEEVRMRPDGTLLDATSGLMVAFALLLAGCGGGGSDSGSAPMSGSSPSLTKSQEAGANKDESSNAPVVAAQRADPSSTSISGAPYILSPVTVPTLPGQIYVPTLPPVDIAFAPSIIKVKMLEAQAWTGMNYNVIATATKNAPSMGLYPYLEDHDSIFQNYQGTEPNRLQFPSFSYGTYGHSFYPGFPINTKLTRGVHSGTVRFRLCVDANCFREFPIGQGRSLPYEITVLPPIELGLEIDGVEIPNPPGRNGTEAIVRPINVSYGAVVTINSSMNVSWGVFTSGMTASSVATTPRTWTGTLAFPQGQAPQPPGNVTVRAHSIGDGDPYSMTGTRELTFHVANP